MNNSVRQTAGARIYNLFPPLAGNFSRWRPHLERAAGMGFDWVYVNPLHYPGFSGSLYAVKDYYQINPAWLDGGGRKKDEKAGSRQPGFEQLSSVIKEAKELGLSLMMDLVINHTAIDSDLVKEHPAWYKRDAAGRIVNPSAMDPADARKITVWGDLAEIDNFNSPDRAGLWAFWEKLCLDYGRLGCRGFRCDAAYQVPVELWDRLIRKVKAKYPGFVFVAETLGCKEKDIVELAQAGFDYIYNSSKWWDLKADWCLRQLESSRRYCPSISFPETHDTPRLAAETGGDAAYQKMRYLLAALFSKGLLLPIGYEFGFRRQLNVVETRPDWWESPSFDLTGFIKQVNAFKAKQPIFNEDNATYQIGNLSNPQVAGLIKIAASGQEKAVLLINTDRQASQAVTLWDLPGVFQASGAVQEIGPGQRPKTVKTRDLTAELAPSEIKILIQTGGGQS